MSGTFLHFITLKILLENYPDYYNYGDPSDADDYEDWAGRTMVISESEIYYLKLIVGDSKCRIIRSLISSAVFTTYY